MSKTTPLARKNDLVIQDLGDELLIYDLKANKALSLNKTSALVWQFSNGEKTIPEITVELEKTLNVSVSQEFVWLALGKLKKENLIETEISNLFEGVARREIIKRVGLTSLVTLPIISSLVAPIATQAASGDCTGPTNLALGCTCSVPESCQSLCCGVTTTASTPRFCVPFQADPIGANCRSGCECVTNLCGFGFVCAADASVAAGGPCRTNRECISGFCGSPASPGNPGGTCSASPGQACTNNNQCISNVCLGNNTCQ
ncbi:MAG: hypothetical protein K1X72_26195 [Pyrinomonadaceae bacterium]|nr:hypothetical protein [Pyrinomonadaceae bacterium]